MQVSLSFYLTDKIYNTKQDRDREKDFTDRLAPIMGGEKTRLIEGLCLVSSKSIIFHI